MSPVGMVKTNFLKRGAASQGGRQAKGFSTPQRGLTERCFRLLPRTLSCSGSCGTWNVALGYSLALGHFLGCLGKFSLGSYFSLILSYPSLHCSPSPSTVPSSSFPFLLSLASGRYFLSAAHCGGGISRSIFLVSNAVFH
jgi:hypothetical protein